MFHIRIPPEGRNSRVGRVWLVSFHGVTCGLLRPLVAVVSVARPRYSLEGGCLRMGK